MSLIKTFKDKLNNIIYPTTHAKAVYVDKSDGSVENLQTHVNSVENGTNINTFNGVETALSTKVDKVTGKGLSTNDYTDNAKAIVDGIDTALNSKSTVTVQTVSSTTSGVTTSEQKIYVDGTPYGVNGSIYMQQSKTVSTSADTSYTFTSSLITADSDISISTTDGISYKSVSSSAGTCTVVIGPQASAASVAVRIYIR